MFGIEGVMAAYAESEASRRHNKDQSERADWEYERLRGPMVEADIDWRVPAPVRRMTEADL